MPMPLKMTRHRMSANGLDQHYLTAGEGPPRRRQLFLKHLEKSRGLAFLTAA
jgi:hypothetical protein